MKENEEYIFKLFDNLIIKTSKLINNFSDEKAYKYFRFGVFIRLMTIKENRDSLQRLIKQEASKHKDTTLETMHINSLYINIFGVLDNLAWVLQHQFILIEGIDEEHKQKNKIGIFGEHFLKRIKQKDADLEVKIESFKDFNEKIKIFRDSSVHRMPLYCPPAIKNKTNS